ncbi:MAG: hypothetical protein EOP09_13385, partial [Proteobacteria bacterium]
MNSFSTGSILSVRLRARLRLTTRPFSLIYPSVFYRTLPWRNVRWDPMQPAAGGSFSVGEAMPRHYRWHGLLPPVARDGLLLSVRRHRLGDFSLDDFVPPEKQDKLLSLVSGQHPVFVMGPTGSGKTSFMVSTLLHCASEERLAILEQLPEVPKLSPRWIRLCAQPANFSGDGAVILEYLIDELLRLRP